MVNGELRMVRRPRAALSPFTASPVAIHHSGRLGGGRTASNVPHTPNTKRPERGAFLWERERPARKSAGTLGGSGKTDDCDGCDAGAMNRSTSPLKRLPAPKAKAALWLSASATYMPPPHRRGAIHCALMGYIQGRSRKRGAMDAPQPVGWANEVCPRGGRKPRGQQATAGRLTHPAWLRGAIAACAIRGGRLSSPGRAKRPPPRSGGNGSFPAGARLRGRRRSPSGAGRGASGAG